MDKKDMEIKALYEKYSCSDKYSCSVEATMDIIGGKWKGVIIYYLMSGVKRHSELKKLMGNVTQRMLTLQLRELGWMDWCIEKFINRYHQRLSIH